MLYNKERNTIIWLPYKNYSSSLMEYFDAHEWRTSHEPTEWQAYISNSIKVNHVPGFNDIGCTRHGITYPVMCHPLNSHAYEWEPRPFKSYRRLLPLRNPYDRVLSMWKFHVDSNREHEWEQGESLKWYMEEVFMFHPLTLPACRIFKHHWQWIIKTEEIEHELIRHEINIPNKIFPQANKSRILLEEIMDKPTIKLWNEKYKPMVAHFHKSDFEAGNYEV